MSKKIAVHCPTKQEFHYAQTKMFEERGWRDEDDKTYHDEDWDRYKGETCLEVTEGMYCFKQWYQGNGYKIIPASEYLEKENVGKLKVGDRVRYMDSLIGIIGCIEGCTAFMSECHDMETGRDFRYPDGGCCDKHKTFMGYTLNELQLVENKTNQPSGEQNKPKGNIMSNIINFAKDLVLSADEKLLRKHGLKDECGNYTEAYNELRRMSANKEFEPKAIEIAKKKEAEETKK